MRRLQTTKALGTLAALAGAMMLIPLHAEASLDTGTVRVFNRSQRNLTVLINGRRHGVAPAGRTQSFFGVRPGMITLVLKDAQGRARSIGRFFLPPRSARLWTVNGPRRAYARTRVRYSGRGVASVQVRHHFPEPVHIWLAKRYCGRAFPGRAVLCNRVPRGTRMLVAKSTLPPYRLLTRRPVDVGKVRFLSLAPPPGAAPVLAMPVAVAPVPAAPPVAQYPSAMMPVAVAPAPGTLRVINRGAEMLNLVVSGQPQGSIAPGAVRDLGVAPGPVHVVATNGAGQLRGDARLFIHSGRVQVWQLNYGGQGYRYAMIPSM